MKKLIIISLAIILSTSALQAQVNSEVEVTKSYVPIVVKAQKPMLEASIIDTAYINPEISYSIIPVSIDTQLQTTPIDPATVTYWQFNRPSIAQLKVGAGYPLNSLLHGYISSHNASVGYIAANIDHRGHYSNVENIYGDKVNALQLLNSGTIAGGVYLADRTLEGDVSYTNNTFANYAFEYPDAKNINYQNIAASIKYGDNFIDLSNYNFSVEAGGALFSDYLSNSEATIQIGALLGKSFDVGNIILGANFKMIDDGDYYSNQTIAFSAMLEKIVSNWQLSAGLLYNMDNSDISSTPNHYFIPKIAIKHALSRSISPFVETGGRVTQNNFSHLLQLNPYVKEGSVAQSSVEYNLAAGLQGQLFSSMFAYKLSAGYKMAQNSLFWGLCVINDDDDHYSYFDLDQDQLDTISFNFDMNFKPTNTLSIDFDAHYYLYNEYQSTSYVNSQPNFEATLGAEYRVRNLGVGAKAHFIGERNYSILIYSTPDSNSPTATTTTPPSVVDFSLYADWCASDTFSFFIEGDNLLNEDLFPWPLYRGYGVTVTAGVKIIF
ncbi:MAG: hypothetical protein R3Y44_00765 [Rikenellaceae bacterium]